MSDQSLDDQLIGNGPLKDATGISIPIRVLILENRLEDAELMLHELRRSWFDPTAVRLETESEYLDALKSPADVILADFRMPQLDASRALELLQGLGLDIPFIVVSSSIGEDAAVALMRQGATDYLLKDRLRRLGPAVRRTLAEKRMREQKREAEQALKASEARFFSFMSNSPALAFIKDSDGRILYMNSTCEQVWAMSLPQCEGKLDRDLRPSGEAARLRVDDLSVLESGHASRTIENLSLPGGGIRHLLSYRFPFDDVAGCRILGGISVDITEQMRTERALAAAVRAKETLLKEVHHRVKNNLQIISSLLNMQAELLSDPQQRLVFQDSQLRVQSMALIHDRLSANDDLEHVDFRDYVEALVRDLFAAHGVDSGRVRLRLDLAKVSLELNQAIPCGLILNELVNNALKYAFPGARTGTIRLALSNDHVDRVTLQVADDGVGMPTGPDRKESLGLGIVDVLARQLGGTIQRGPGPGVNFSLVFEKAGPPPVPSPPQTKAFGSGT
jgi:two-component sensor histidine kinase/PAS domain-containing protein